MTGRRRPRVGVVRVVREAREWHHRGRQYEPRALKPFLATNITHTFECDPIGAYDISSFIRDRLFQLNLRLNRPNDPFEGSFGHLIVSTPLHCPIRTTLQFPERGDFIGAVGA